MGLELRGWRVYPRRDRFIFGAGFDDGRHQLTEVEPENRGKRAPKPREQSGAELMAALEASLAAVRN